MSFFVKVSALDSRAHGLEGKLTACHTELLTLRGRYSVLSEQYERLQQGADRLIPLSVHNAAINECKRLVNLLSWENVVVLTQFSYIFLCFMRLV